MNNLKDILAVSYEMADEPTVSLVCAIVKERLPSIHCLVKQGGNHES